MGQRAEQEQPEQGDPQEQQVEWQVEFPSLPFSYPYFCPRMVIYLSLSSYIRNHAQGSMDR